MKKYNSRDFIVNWKNMKLNITKMNSTKKFNI